MSPLNPSIRLSAAPSAACLPEKDGREFSALLQCGRLAANSVGGHYPNLSEPNQLNAAYASQEGNIVLSHLSAVMYSYWDQAPSGPSVYDITTEHLIPSMRAVCRRECAAWGTRRLNAPVGKTLFIVSDGSDGAVVADHTMTKFYKVLGLKRSPAASLARVGVALPAAVRITALPFRGVLVYDGIIGGTQPRTVSRSEAQTLNRRFAEAQRRGKVITGFHVDAPTPGRVDRSGGTSNRGIDDLSPTEKQQVDRMKAATKVDEMVTFRRLGYTQQENPNNGVIIMWSARPCGSFFTAALVPSKDEILHELVKLANSNGTLPKMVAVDDKSTADAVHEVTKHADIQTGFYPSPSVEEHVLLNSLPSFVLEALKGFGR